jgi:hypothetical protein
MRWVRCGGQTGFYIHFGCMCSFSKPHLAGRRTGAHLSTAETNLGWIDACIGIGKQINYTTRRK